MVLREVLAWLAGAELARAGAVCRAWARAAGDPALWRRLLLRDALLPLPRGTVPCHAVSCRAMPCHAVSALSPAQQLACVVC